MTGSTLGSPDAEVRQRRFVRPLCPPTLLGVAIALAVAWARCAPPVGGTPTDAVYTVAYLSAQLAVHPAPWVGREIRLRAVAVVLPLWVMRGTVPARRPVSLLDDPRDGGSLPLVLGPQNRLLAALRWLPVVGVLAPPPQARVWEGSAVYRVQLEAVRGSAGATYGATLLDASPPDK